MKGLDYALLTCKEQHFCYFCAGEVVENRSVGRHFRLGGGAILMVLVVFEHFHTRGCCFQRYGYIYGISVREDDDLEVRGGIYIQYFASAHNGAILQVQGGGIYSTCLRGNAKICQ